MWQLKKIQATNICAFEQLEYAPFQNQATLVFGNNLDSDSQNSNGSGKSALVEAIAIGLFGEPLRKVNADEIINDRFNNANVTMILFNSATQKSLSISRNLSRKKPQDIQIVEWNKEDGIMREIKQASVLDYNKYVLEQIGLSKDDLLHNFILTARKYQSFLSCADKDKKEIINRFSNGVMVDESINILRADIEPLQKEMQQAENEVAKCNGRISALEEEIECIVKDEALNQYNVQKQIENINETIAQKRESIRIYKKHIESADLRLKEITKLSLKLEALERTGIDVLQTYQTIKTSFANFNLPAISDYATKIEQNKETCLNAQIHVDNLTTEAKKIAESVALLESEAADIDQANQAKFSEFDDASQSLEKEIAELRTEVTELRNHSNNLIKKRNDLNAAIGNLQKTLAGVIKCPNCNHEFFYKDGSNVDDVRLELNALESSLKHIEDDIELADEERIKCVNKGRQKRNQQTELSNAKQLLLQKCNEAKAKLVSFQNRQFSLNRRLEEAKSQLRLAQSSVTEMRTKMFDEVFDILNPQMKVGTQTIEGLERDIRITQASIETHEEQIKRLQVATNGHELERIKESKAKSEQALKEAEAKKSCIEEQLGELKTQETTFIEFKTYLANQKIKAIAQITNDFLEAIGSDIRINLSGYTILKSGKVRDKISVSLLRDGIECGSFDKFSAGEKCRVELANVLALHKLSNVNCEDNKGLNLLVIDEILDCTDETGLANVFKALNSIKITSLIITHGNIAENYQNRLLITKQNGVSKISE